MPQGWREPGPGPRISKWLHITGPQPQIKYYTRCLSLCFRKVNLCSQFSLWLRIALVIFRNITYVALTNKMADTCVRLRQSCVQARPVRFGQDDCTMYTHCLRCMTWIGLTNKMVETCVSYASARVNMSKICNRYLAKIDIWYNI